MDRRPIFVSLQKVHYGNRIPAFNMFIYCPLTVKKVNVWFYIAQYPVRWPTQAQGWKLTLARGELNSVRASGSSDLTSPVGEWIFFFLGLLLLLFEKR